MRDEDAVEISEIRCLFSINRNFQPFRASSATRQPQSQRKDTTK